MIKRINFNGIDIIIGKSQDILTYVLKEGTRKKWVTTLNALMYMEYLKGDEYKEALKKSTFAIPDGFGIVRLLKKNGYVTEKCSGIDTMKELCRKKESKIYLLGAKQDVVKKAAENLKNKFNTDVCGYHHGYFLEEEEEKIIEDINASGAKYLFVGMGIPRQEIFILKNLKKLNVEFVMGVGGSIDVFANKVKRAPKFFQRFGLEWLYRMVCEPKRLKKLPDLIKFYIKIYLKRV